MSRSATTRTPKGSRLVSRAEETFWASRTHVVLEALIASGALKGVDQAEFQQKIADQFDPEDGPELRKVKAYIALHEATMSEHTCHAIGCSTPCPPEYLMCPRHWRMVPYKFQRRVWATYRDGQCDDMNPSAEWHLAADAAICAVALKEGHITREQARAKLAKSVEYARKFREKAET